MQNDVDGILAKLKKTLTNNEGFSKRKDNNQLEERAFNIPNKESYAIDLILKEKMLSFFNKELEKKCSAFFSNDEGKEFLTNAVNKFFEKNEYLIEDIIKSEISQRIKNIKL